ncbi:MAG: hypothetical protein WDM86_21520 [Rhizomicrobium sp.]
MKFRTLMMSTAFALLAAPALAADAAPPVPLLVRGVIASFDGKSVTITKADGTSVTGAVGPGTFFSAVEPRRFDQIKATDFVGITSVPGPGDTLKAEEIHILPIHVGEGSYPWDHHPGGARATAGSMTNGTVAVVQTAPVTAGSMTNGTVTMSGGQTLKVTYRGAGIVDGKCVGHAPAAGGCTGVASVAVTPQTQIVAIVPAQPTDPKPGLAVFAGAATLADGKIVIGSLVLEKNGVKPPM